MKNKIYIVACLIAVLAIVLAACSAPFADDVTGNAPVEKNDAVDADSVSLKTHVPVQLTVRYVSGEAFMIRDGEEIEIKKDDFICEGDEIKTGKDGLVILKLEGSKQIHIAESTHFIVSALRSDEEGEIAEFSLEKGNVVSVINEALRASESYEIETPELIMAIRGTIVSVDYNPDAGCSRATFFEGRGVISSKKNADVAEVSAGEAAETSGGKLERTEAHPSSLSAAEQRFLFDDDYRELIDDEDAEITFLRMEMILSKQDFVEAKKSYDNRNGNLSKAISDDTDSVSDNNQITDKAFSLENARDSFTEYHPDAEIFVAKREGNVYYVEGYDGAVIYKMKFKTDDGEVVLDLTVDTSRR